MRNTDMITQDEFAAYFNQLLPTTSVEEEEEEEGQQMIIQILILGCKGLIN